MRGTKSLCVARSLTYRALPRQDVPGKRLSANQPSPIERNKRENRSARLETAGAPGEVEGGLRRAAQSRADDNIYGRWKDNTTAALEGYKQEVGDGGRAWWEIKEKYVITI